MRALFFCRVVRRSMIRKKGSIAFCTLPFARQAETKSGSSSSLARAAPADETVSRRPGNRQPNDRPLATQYGHRAFDADLCSGEPGHNAARIACKSPEHSNDVCLIIPRDREPLTARQPHSQMHATPAPVPIRRHRPPQASQGTSLDVLVSFIRPPIIRFSGFLSNSNYIKKDV